MIELSLDDLSELLTGLYQCDVGAADSLNPRVMRRKELYTMLANELSKAWLPSKRRRKVTLVFRTVEAGLKGEG